MLRDLIKAVIGIPATLIANLAYLPLRQAIRFPIFCSMHVRIRGQGRVVLFGPVRPGMIRLGFGDVGVVPPSALLFEIKKGRTVSFYGRCRINYACRIVVGGHLVLGSNVVIQPRSAIVAWKCVEIGGDSLVSWDCQILDTDFHVIRGVDSGLIINADAPIKLGARTWLGSRVQVLKGAVVPDGCIVAAGAIVTGRIETPSSILAGIPARIIRAGVDWVP